MTHMKLPSKAKAVAADSGLLAKLYEGKAQHVCSGRIAKEQRHIAAITAKLGGHFVIRTISAQRYLITLEELWVNDEIVDGLLEIYDLVDGKVSRLQRLTRHHAFLQHHTFNNAKVFDDNLLLFPGRLGAGPSHMAVYLSDLHENAKHSGSPRSVELVGLESSMLPSRALHHIWKRGYEGLNLGHAGGREPTEGASHPSPTILVPPVMEFHIPSDFAPSPDTKPHISSPLRLRTDVNLTAPPTHRVRWICVPSSGGQWGMTTLHANGPAVTLVIRRILIQTVDDEDSQTSIHIYEVPQSNLTGTKKGISYRQWRDARDVYFDNLHNTELSLKVSILSTASANARRLFQMPSTAPAWDLLMTGPQCVSAVASYTVKNDIASRPIQGSGGTHVNETDRRNLSNLPGDVIISILTPSLTPWDLLAVSHTCRSLRLCITYRSVWAAAWKRSSHDRRLPPFPPPTIKRHPQMSDDNIDAEDNGMGSLYASSITPMVGFSAVELKDDERSESGGGMCNYAIHFWKALRIQHRLRQPNVVLRPIAEPLYTSTRLDGLHAGLLVGGNYVLLRNLGSTSILDIQARIQYNIAIPPQHGLVSSYGSIVRYNGCAGLLLVLLRSTVDEGTQGVDLLFQPFSPDPRSLKCPVVEYITTINPKFGGSFEEVILSAQHYLITIEAEIEDHIYARSSTQIYDLVDGRISNLTSSPTAQQDDYFDAAVVYDDNVLLLATEEGEYKYQMMHFDDLPRNAQNSRPLQPIEEHDSLHSLPPSVHALHHVWRRSYQHPSGQHADYKLSSSYPLLVKAHYIEPLGLTAPPLWLMVQITASRVLNDIHECGRRSLPLNLSIFTPPSRI
ncbi:hypothetical protein DL93DRAFT_2152407 [Clavulina sp. PMI_390]|nr:hypothetical protein DL93DRAFT_2152407 [Clavulina sp. PMI_390]